jgi:hypothetical protein
MLDLLLIPQATNKRDRERDEQRSLRERTEEKAFKTCHENQPKIQRFIPKIHRNEIHHATNLIPKIIGIDPNSRKLGSRPCMKLGKKKNENHSFRIGIPEDFESQK